MGYGRLRPLTMFDPPMNPFSGPATPLLLRLVIGTVIAVTLGLCSLKHVMHSTEKVAKVIGIIGEVTDTIGTRNDFAESGPRP
jgi:hypothetical protein